MNPLRSVLAIGAGFFTTAVLSLVGDYVLRALRPEFFGADGRIQDANVFGIMLLYQLVCGMFGGYIAARIAIQRPLLHAAFLGAALFAFSVLSAVFLWGTAPVWYHVATLVMALSAAFLGGVVRELQVRHA